MPNWSTFRKFQLSGRHIAGKYEKRHGPLHEANYEVHVREYGPPKFRKPDVVSVFYLPKGGPKKVFRKGLKELPTHVDLKLIHLPAGIVVREMQTVGPTPKPNDPDSHLVYPFLNKKIGAGIGLEALKTLYPDQTIYVRGPSEVRRDWGKESPFYVLRPLGEGPEFENASPHFAEFVRERYPNDSMRILKRFVHEHPRMLFPGGLYASRIAAMPPDLRGPLQAEVQKLRARRAVKIVPGKRILKKATAAYMEYLRDLRKAHSAPESVLIPIGKRRSRGYYSTVPRKHGFSPVRQYNIEELGRIYASRFSPEDRKPGDGLDLVWRKIR